MKRKSTKSRSKKRSKQVIFKFPNQDTLLLALKSGAVPPEVSQTSATVGYGTDGQIWVEPPEPPTRTAQDKIKKIGAETSKSNDGDIQKTVCSWVEILPLVHDTKWQEQLEKLPVLFHIQEQKDFSKLVLEVLRLGNDRQQYRWTNDQALLRVVGPPYYSLLGCNRDGIKTYYEQAHKVWIELGYSHPLAASVKPPEGKILLISSPKQWLFIDDKPYKDVYEALDFTLPNQPGKWKEGELPDKVKVQVKLTTGGAPEGAELWVLYEDAEKELNRFVQNNDDKMLERLAFAVGTRKDKTVIVIKVRPSRQGPPVLPLSSAVACKPFLKLPNLFMPVGKMLHPPLRRDIVRKLLAEDTSKTIWLNPDEEKFKIESLPEDAFRPLSDWIDYVIDKERVPLQAWVDANQFLFESFVSDEENVRPKPPPAAESRRSRNRSSGDSRDFQDVEHTTLDWSMLPEPEPEQEELVIEKIEPSKVQIQLAEVERKFLSIEGNLDAPERMKLWSELTRLNTLLANYKEASLCWVNHLWNRKALTEAEAQRWLYIEANNAKPSGSKKNMWEQTTKGQEVSYTALDKLLQEADPTSANICALAAYTVVQTLKKNNSKEHTQHLPEIQKFLLTHERLMPARVAWILWNELAKSTGDALALARARDRLLERLFRIGLHAEQDTPSFLRFGNKGSYSSKFRGIGTWLRKLADKTHQWTSKQGSEFTTSESESQTNAYSDLLYAFGLARLGDQDSATELLNRAKRVLTNRDDAHTFLLNSFEYRIRNILEGKQHGGQLPPILINQLEALRKNRKASDVPGSSYIIDAMRRISRTLEPHQHVDAFLQTFASTDEAAMAELSRTQNKDELVTKIKALLKKTPKGAGGWRTRSTLLKNALFEAPRVGEAFSQELLAEAVETFDALIGTADPYDLTNLIPLTEQGLFVAAHYDLTSTLNNLVSRFKALLKALHAGPGLRDFESVASTCFKGLRKLGLRDQVEQLLNHTSDLLTSSRKGTNEDDILLCSLLHVAAGWLYFGKEKQAEAVLQDSRKLLLRNELQPIRQTALACAYIPALCQTPVETAQKHLEEVFEKVSCIRGSTVTHKWYSQAQIKVIEAAVLSIASDDFVLDQDTRKWMDEGEFLVRRRMHSDYRELSNG